MLKITKENYKKIKDGEKLTRGMLEAELKECEDEIRLINSNKSLTAEKKSKDIKLIEDHIKNLKIILKTKKYAT